jgi:anti-sigma regulatory factor (Ser/Thr protein kinase)/ABC-type transporter Mla MlaB component
MSTDGGHRPPPEPSPPEPSPLEPSPPEPSPLKPRPLKPRPLKPEPPGREPQPGSLTGHPDALILDQAFDEDSLYALRAAVAAHATQAGLAPGRSDDLVIAVHELAANSVRHGAGHGRLRVWKSDRALLCEISDDGIPQPAGTGDATQWRTEPGHGLSLVRQVADQASLHSGPSGTLATISFALDGPGPPFHLDQRHQDGCTILAVTGPLDLGSAAQLTAAIASLLTRALPEAQAPSPPSVGPPPHPGLRLVLDLSGLSGWDSAGLAALITAQQRINAAPPARMVLAGLPDHLAKHLREPGLADRFTLAGTPAAAVATLTPPV